MDNIMNKEVQDRMLFACGFLMIVVVAIAFMAWLQ
jgi:hypothetical protein